MKGFAAISVVLILSVVTLSIAVTVSLLAVGEGQTALSLFKGEDNLSVAEACMENVILNIRANKNYAASSITIAGVTCTITYTTTYPSWDVVVTPPAVSPTNNYQRKIEAKFISDGYGITITSWQEI